MPRTTQHTIYKSTPQLTEECFHALAQAADECSALLMQSSAIFGRDEQHLGFISHSFSQRCTDITQVTQRHAAINRQSQRRSSVTVIVVGRQQQSATDVSVQVT